MSTDALKLIKELQFEPQSLKAYDKGFKAVTKITFNTTQPTRSMLEDRLYYDDLSEENYSYGNGLYFQLKEFFHPAMIGANPLEKWQWQVKYFSRQQLFL